MLLRDYLYVDTEKSRGLLAQIEGGIAESVTGSDSHEKSTEAGVKGFGSHKQVWAEGSSVSKSLGDALFSALEETLDAHSLIDDVSAYLASSANWQSQPLRLRLSPGSLVRITAPGILFDARYVAQIMGGFVASYQGLSDMGVDASSGGTSSSATALQPPKGQRGKAAPKPHRTGPLPTGQLEDAIPDFQPIRAPKGQTITSDYIRGIIRLSRGIFTPGLHLSLQPCSQRSYAVTARLQEGRAFLDSESDILFARYGTTPQEWTLVGSVGAFGSDLADFDPSKSSAVTAKGSVDRPGTAAFINEFLNFIGRLGFADLPQSPGFSVVPLAVYRTIRTPAAEEPQD